MTPKAIITLVIGILALGITTWKGPGAWGAISSGITAIVIFVATLKITPPKDEEYIADLEEALSKTQNTPEVPVAADLLPAKSKARYLKVTS